MRVAIAKTPMPVSLSTSDADFEPRFTALLNARHEESPNVDTAVEKIILDVRQRGDTALIELTERFDRQSLTADRLVISRAEIDSAIKNVTEDERHALKLAASRIRSYHKRQMPADAEWTDESGASLGWRWTPLPSAGLYVPGGLASYPSSVLMNAIPAKVAGVERLAITVPAPQGEVNPLVLLATRLAEVDEIYRVGGAQAIAALAYGTETIAPVAKITGPGNAYVAAAKRQVFGQVGIDTIAGPSEILVIADRHNNPDWIALDLLSQAEHDENAQSILITNDRAFGQVVARAVDKFLLTLDRRDIAHASWHRFGAIIVVGDMNQAAELANRVAPEHLELCVTDPINLVERCRHAGAIFVGNWTPEVIGDYVAGPNHVLPTARSARFSSGLSVMDFLKRTTVTRMTPEALLSLGPAAERLAVSEGLQAHGLAVRARLDSLNDTGNV